MFIISSGTKMKCLRRLLFFAVILAATGVCQETGARYLIITHDNFYNDILPLAQWKHKKGMRAKVIRLSEIGSTAPQIRDYTVNAYNNWQIKPEYILFVGAPNYIPFPLVLGWNSDNYYTNMDNDLYNEILSGRLTVHNSTETKTVVQKILSYERYPNTTDTFWFKRACLIANEDYGYYPPMGNDTVYWNDVRHARNLMLANGYDLIDTLSAGLGNNANSVYQSINNGKGFLLYRGIGLGQWYQPFDCNPDLTTNGTKLPIVLSITCRTIGTGSSPAQVERWLLTGSPTNLKGGAGFFATTTVGGGFITFLRSAVSRGFFDAIFVDGKRTFGEACEGGRIRVYTMYPYSGGDEEYVGFTTIGDPEMNIWTAPPCSLMVIHPQAIPFGSANFTVTVKRAVDLSPISNAFVCIMAKQDTNIYVLDTTDINGQAYFSINPVIVADTVYVTVTGKNLRPYEGNMIVQHSGIPYVVYLKSSVDDSLSGNNNHLINPGETINLPLWVKNWGDSMAHNVSGLLRTNDIYIIILDSIKWFGDIQGGDSAFTGSNGYIFSVSSSCPDLYNIAFNLICKDMNDSVWISHFTRTVYAPELNFLETLISGGNGNSNLEPGETVFVRVKIKNTGHSPIDTVTAILQSLSNYALVIDSVGSYTHLGIDSSAINDSDSFIIYADSSAPQGILVGFRMVLSSSFYQDTITFSIVIGKKDYFIWNPDLTPQPGQNMHNILNTLGYSGEISANLPAVLGLYNCIFVCLGVFPNNYVIQSGSPEAQRLLDFVSAGGRLYIEGGDVWYYDPFNGGYDFSNIFGLNPVDDGGSNMGPVGGIAGTFTQGMDFNYGGENEYMDHISPSHPGAFLIFRDTDNYFDCGVAYDAGTYRTVATSFELGALIDGTPPSTRAVLLDSIMHFFGASHGINENNFPKLISTMPSLQVYPSPFRNHCVIKFQIPGTKSQTNPESQIPNDNVGQGFSLAQVVSSQYPVVSIKIYDISGRSVKQFNHLSANHPPRNLADGGIQPFNQVVWYGDDDAGRRLPAGVYFVKFDCENYRNVKKAVLLR
ncbi:MAG: C25 family cysteine peptidase [bacterium]